MNNQPPKLQPQHLYERREKRDNARLKSYNQLLEQIQHRIFTTSQLPGSPAHLLYTVPPFVIGLPHFDLQDCIIYIVFHLRNNGFEVRFTYPNLLYISWSSYEKEYFLKKNPIVQAMIPPTAPTPKKSGKQATIAPPIQNPYTETITVPPIRSANDYAPPNSFLDTLQKPQHHIKDGVSGAGNIVADLWKFI
jgi:hypothetical protein